MQKGQLKRWNDEKGFGFIRPENGDEDIFFHISSLKRTARRPTLGDNMYFNVVVDQQGRRKAIDVSIEGVKSVFSELSLAKADSKLQQHKQVRSNTSRSGSFSPSYRRNRPIFGVVIAIAAIAVVFGVDRINQKHFSEDTAVMSVDSSEDETNFTSQFKCEGKTRCSQMTSCEEAMFYLNNCPGSVTDGDGDGRPCEDQWCGH
ncbi:MAG: cold shock domain-containing protein [Gammaproteobacteria bacterium]